MKLHSPLVYGAAVILAFVLTACAEVSVADNPPAVEASISLSAEGSVIAAPDMATVSAGVIAEGKTAAEAMAAQRTQMARAIDTLKKAGIPEKDIQTAGLNLSPKYSNQRMRSDDGAYESPRIVGYTASNQINVVARDLSKVGAMLDALVAAGVNNIGGIGFGISNRESLMDQARGEAMRALKARSKLYADAGGFRIGRLISLTENYAAPYPVAMMRMEAMAMDSGPTPVQGGEMQISITVNGVYQIEE
jgi:uncharacterized protein